MNVVRAFIAVEVDNPEVIRKIKMVQDEIKSSGSALTKDVELGNLHITLKFLGEINSYKVEQVKQELKKIKFNPFEVVFKGVGYFPGGSRVNVIWVGVEDFDGVLNRLGNEVQQRMGKLGFQPEKFTPHLTIARVKSVKDKHTLLQILANYGNELFGRQRIECIYLKKSILTQKGPIYEDLMRHEGGRE